MIGALTLPWAWGGGAAAVIEPITPVVTATGIYDYGSLKAAVAAFMHRADLETHMDTVADLTEAKIRRLLRDRTVGPVDFLLSDGAALPSDCGELRSISYKGGTLQSYAIAVSSPTAVAVRKGLRSPAAAYPELVAVVQRAFMVAPAIATPTPVVLTYYQTVPPLVHDTDTNWLLDSDPDVYLYGMLSGFAKFTVEDERIAMWQEAFMTAMKEMERARERREYEAAPLEPINEYTF